jgi:hypothetical protein
MTFEGEIPNIMNIEVLLASIQRSGTCLATHGLRAIARSRLKRMSMETGS